jgi:integrase
MPATQRGQAYKISSCKWGLRYYDQDGVRRRESPFPSKSVALAHFRDVIEPRLRGEVPPQADLLLAEFVPLWLERHAATVRPRTIATLRERLRHAERAFGNVPLRELTGMAAEIAAWRAVQPERVRHHRLGALRQCLAAAERWGYIDRNPAALAGRNRQPSPRVVRVSTRAELDAIAAELARHYAPLPALAAATGLRREEWGALQRPDIDRREGLLTVARTISSGELVELGKTSRSRRQVPLSPRALQALDELPARWTRRCCSPRRRVVS